MIGTFLFRDQMSMKSTKLLKDSVADPERFDADPDLDPDPTFQADADPNPNPFTRVTNFFSSNLQLLFPKSSKLSCVISQQECGRKGEG